MRLQSYGSQSAQKKRLPGRGSRNDVDLEGGGSPEFVWQLNTVVGATGGSAHIVTGAWEPGRIRQLGNAVYMPNPTAVALADQTLTVSGGMAGGAGARAVQRPRTDRYRWQQGGWRLVDRQFVTVDQGYYHLIDGIVAEMFGRPTDAEAAYRKAFDPSPCRTTPAPLPTCSPPWPPLLVTGSSCAVRPRSGRRSTRIL